MTPPRTPRKRKAQTPLQRMRKQIKRGGRGQKTLYLRQSYRVAGKRKWPKKYGKKKGRKKGKRHMDMTKAVEACQNHGVSYVNEYYGTVTDPDSLYVMECSANPGSEILFLVCGLLRRLLEKFGIRVTGIRDVLPLDTLGGLNQTSAALNLAIHLYSRRSTGAATHKVADMFIVDVYYLTVTSTLLDVANQFIQYFRDYSSGTNIGAGGIGDDLNLVELVGFTIRDFGGVSFVTSIQTTLYFDECYVEAYSSSELRFQNRTLAENTNSNALDVTNQPLRAREYHFGGLPKTNGAARQQMFRQFPVNYGVKVITAANTGDEAMKTLPAKNMFINCKKMKDFVLNPGVCQKRIVSHHIPKMKVLTFLKKLRVQWGLNVALNQNLSYETNYTIYPTVLLGFEDYIKIAGGPDPIVAYEVYRRSGMVVTEKKKLFCKIDYAQGTITQSA